jgi:ABC-type glycerol-3-phosphate transport system permease component
LPGANPALAAPAIFIFLGSGNNFLLPLVIISNSEMFTLPLGLNTFKRQYISYWNYIMISIATLYKELRLLVVSDMSEVGNAGLPRD